MSTRTTDDEQRRSGSSSRSSSGSDADDARGGVAVVTAPHSSDTAAAAATPTTAAPAPPPTSADYCDVYIHGVTGPLHIALPSDTAHTSVRQLRALVLSALPAASQANNNNGSSNDGARTAAAAGGGQPSQRQQRYVRLMFRGKELRQDELSLSQYGVQSGSALHALVTTVQPRYQSVSRGGGNALAPLSSQNMHNAREAIANALHAIWPTTTPTPALAGEAVPAATAAAAAANASADAATRAAAAESAQRLRLLHTERLLRAQSTGLPRVTDTTTAATAEAAAGGGGRDAGGRLRVMQLTDTPMTTTTTGAVATTGGGGGGAPLPPVLLADEADEAAFMAEQLRRLRVFAVAFVAGFVLGPLCFVLPTSMFATTGLIVGCCANVLCCWVIYSDSILSWA